MSPHPEHPRGRTLDEVIASYLQARRGGVAPSPETLIAQHSEMETELRAFFNTIEETESLQSINPKRQDITTVSLEAAQHATISAPAAFANAKREPILPGSLFAERYRIFDVASGGMARVYFAEDLQIAKDGTPLKVAIKTVPDFVEWRTRQPAQLEEREEVIYEGLVARFRSEALTWVKLGTHPNVLWALYVIEVGAKPYLVTEFADSGDLRRWIQNRLLPLPLALNFARQICAGMSHVCRVAGLVHRDLKPANLLVHGNRIVKVADFGLARAFQHGKDSRAVQPISPDDANSRIGAGTPAYMAPEQFRALELADTRSDIFSFGAVLYEMLTNQKLFSTISSWAMSEVNMPICRVHEVNDAIPRELSDIVAKCLAYDASLRFSSFDELDAALQRVEAAVPGRLPPVVDEAHVRRAELHNPSRDLLGETYALLSLGRHAEAVVCADQAIALDSNNYQHWVNKGKGLFEQQMFSEALHCWDKAIQLNPTDAAVWANLGWARLQLGSALEGLRDALCAIQLAPGLGDAWMCRGTCESALGRYAAAEQSLQTAIGLEPHNWKALFNLGLCMVNLRRFREAKDALCRAVSINPRAFACWVQLAWVNARILAWADARTAIDVATRLSPSDATAWAFSAWIAFAGENDRVRARADLARSLELDPQNHQAKIVLSTMGPDLTRQESE